MESVLSVQHYCWQFDLLCFAALSHHEATTESSFLHICKSVTSLCYLNCLYLKWYYLFRYSANDLWGCNVGCIYRLQIATCSHGCNKIFTAWPCIQIHPTRQLPYDAHETNVSAPRTPLLHVMSTGKEQIVQWKKASSWLMIVNPFGEDKHSPSQLPAHSLGKCQLCQM